MLLLEALVRISAITMLVALAFTAIRDLRPSRSWAYMALACLSTAALFVSLSSKALAPRYEVALVAGFFNIPHLVLVWLFALSVFQTDFRLRLWHLIIGAIYIFPIIWFRGYQHEFWPQPPVFMTVGVSIGSVLLMGHLIWAILRENQGDLVVERKRARSIFVIVLVLVTTLTAAADIYLISVRPAWAGLIKAAAIWPAVLAGFVWIIRGRPSVFVTRISPQTFASGQVGVGSKDRELFQALEAKMQSENVYLDPALSINVLAKDLGVTSHRLRALINQTLGFENFNQFLNSFRIEAIKAKLDDQEFDHLPILTLALDGGFRSLSPFNKAFKTAMGQTPSEYRKARRSQLI